MKDICGTICNQDNMVGDSDYIDLEKWTGRPLSRLPLSIREKDEPLMHVNSLSYLVDDPACDPRTGGIAGYENIARIYGVGLQQFRRNIAPKLSYLKWLEDIPVTHVSSAMNDAELYKIEIRKSWMGNLGLDR